MIHRGGAIKLYQALHSMSGQAGQCGADSPNTNGVDFPKQVKAWGGLPKLLPKQAFGPNALEPGLEQGPSVELLPVKVYVCTKVIYLLITRG